jgi:hypothetical protein
MSESDDFYTEILYPLQNGVLSLLADCNAPFYLTGGTALHRHHFSYRYSDDLDLFVNQDPRYDEYVDAALHALRSSPYTIDGSAFLRNEQYTRVMVQTPEAILKIDFVNDSAPRYGTTVKGSIYPRIDPIRNILSNKVTAIYRLEAKDVADVWAICTHVSFGWADVMAEAASKEAGIDSATVSDLLRSFPREMFDSIRWREKPEPELFYADLSRIAEDLLEVKTNSLCIQRDP